MAEGDNLSIDPELEAMLAGGEDGGEAAPADPAAGRARSGTGEDAVAASRAKLGEAGSRNLDFLLDIKMDVTFEVGQAKMLISDLLTLGQGSVIELHRMVGEELDFLVNGKLVAKGEVVVSNEKFSCRITHIVAPEERIKFMGNM
ncbi:MAG: flagellar motor switch protein FliN [Deltaproteobacteria bacterium]|nr:flagellar motor switch protein FliN [Deltaproteobacteria bacterium]